MYTLSKGKTSLHYIHYFVRNGEDVNINYEYSHTFISVMFTYEPGIHRYISIKSVTNNPNILLHSLHLNHHLKIF